jgi:hypothetical protein
MSNKVHRTFFGKIFGTAWDSIKGFFSKAWDAADHDLLEFAVQVTQALKDGLQSGVVKAIVDATPTVLDENILQAVNNFLPKLLADELLLKDIHDNSTEADTQDVAKKILDSFGGLSDEKKEEFYTSTSAKIYALAVKIKHGEHITFGQAAQLVESAYQEWKNANNNA